MPILRRKIIRLLQVLHLNNIAYNCLSRGIRSNLSYPDILTSDDAIRYLNSIHPDLHSSCVHENSFKEILYDLDIVVPCYNVELYVEDCIHSILSQQTQYSFHIIIVNDGSTDKTTEVLKQFEGIPNIQILHQENRGFSEARNTGIKEAQGKYLMFIDSDDLLAPNAIESMMNLAYKIDADIVEGTHIRFADEKQPGLKNRLHRAIYNARQKEYGSRYNENATSINGFFWGKVFNRSIFDKILLPKGYWFEDQITCMILEQMAKRMASSGQLAYRYRMNPHSITHSYGCNVKSLDSLYLTLQILKDIPSLGIKTDETFYNRLLGQMEINISRVIGLDPKVMHTVLFIEHEILQKEFPTQRTSDKSLKIVEALIRNRDTQHLSLYCKLHS